MISNIQQKRERRSDFNEQYAKLDERKVEVTLRDIYRDYRHYRNAYYFISTKREEEPPPIDPAQFSVKKLFV